MTVRAGMAVHYKGMPPFLGRQIRERSRGVERLFAFNFDGSELRVSQCPQRFRRVLRRVFQGIHVAKCHQPKTAAEVFSKAQQDGNGAIRQFLAFGLEAVTCGVVGGQLVLELRAVGPDHSVIILSDAVPAFVAR